MSDTHTPPGSDSAKIDPNTIGNTAVRRTRAFTLRHRRLDVDCAAHGILSGGEFHQHTVAGGLYDVAAAALDLGVDHLPAVSFLTQEHILLVQLHEPAIAHHVGGQDSC
jgi:hypothetical protein